MVKAGVYLVARMTPGFADSPPWRPTVITLGVLTMLLAGWRAVREYDLKLILAFGTVSQLGLITVMVGAGGGDMMLAGLAMLCAHAMFKAALFMVVGVIDHATGTRDIRRLAWLGQRSRPLLVIAVGATASMAALPPFLGFVAKEADFETVAAQPVTRRRGALRARRHRARLGVHHHLQPALPVGSVRPQGMTGAQQAGRRNAPPAKPLSSSAPAILAAAGLVFGVWPARLDDVLDTYADTVPGGEDYDLALWHGFGSAAAAVGAGAGRRHRGVLRPRPAAPAADRCASRWATPTASTTPSLRGADLLSVRLTAFTQRGSIPATQSVILSTLVLVPVIVLALGARDRPDFALWDSPLQVVVGLLILAAALGATMMRNRLAAVLLVGVTGYGCGTIFAFHGAPDLALTQFLVETLTLVIFVLVLRALPAEADRANIARQPVAARRAGARGRRNRHHARGLRDGRPHRHPDRRIAARRRVLPRPRRQHRQRPAGRHPGLGHHGRDLGAAGRRDRRGVNGVPAQAFRRRTAGLRRRPARHRPRSPRSRHSPAVGDITWLRGSELRDPRHRSLVLEVATRIIFPLIMVLSAYFFFAGHNTPGGGFAGGLTAGLALVLRYLAGGRYELGETLPLDAGKILGVGLGLSAGTAVASLLVGAPVLSSALIRDRRAGARHRQVRHRVVLRPRRVPDRRRPRARRAAQPRRAGGRGDERATARRWRDDHLPRSAGAHRRPHQRRACTCCWSAI